MVAMEKDTNSLDDFFDKQETPKVKVHKKPENTCISCEG